MKDQQIVEAARRFLAALPDQNLRDHNDMTFGYCPICDESEGHAVDCEFLVLKDLLTRDD
jgi:hypothetical protein